MEAALAAIQAAVNSSFNPFAALLPPNRAVSPAGIAQLSPQLPNTAPTPAGDGGVSLSTGTSPAAPAEEEGAGEGGGAGGADDREEAECFKSYAVHTQTAKDMMVRHNLKLVHPSPIVTSSTLASIEAPPLGPQHVHPHLDHILKLLHPGISPAQAEFAVRAYFRWATTLSDGETTAGIWNNGGTGIGKTRDIVATLAPRFIAPAMAAKRDLLPADHRAFTERLRGVAPMYAPTLGERKVLWLSPSNDLVAPLLKDLAAVMLGGGSGGGSGGGDRRLPAYLPPFVVLGDLKLEPGRTLQSYTLAQLGKALRNRGEVDPDTLRERFTHGIVFATYTAITTTKAANRRSRGGGGGAGAGAGGSDAETESEEEDGDGESEAGSTATGASGGSGKVKPKAAAAARRRSSSAVARESGARGRGGRGKGRGAGGGGAAASRGSSAAGIVGLGAGAAAADDSNDNGDDDGEAAGEDGGLDPFTPAFSVSDVARCGGVMEALHMLTHVSAADRAAFFGQRAARPSNRFEQALLWLGERSDGMLVMDESHKAKNALPETISAMMKTMSDKAAKVARRVIDGVSSGKLDGAPPPAPGAVGVQMSDDDRDDTALVYRLRLEAAGGGPGAAALLPAPARKGGGKGRRSSGSGGAAGYSSGVRQAAISMLPGLDEPPRFRPRVLSGITRCGALIMRLQACLPKIQCCFVSATGATEIRHLAYMGFRLGLFGEIMTAQERDSVSPDSIVRQACDSMGGIEAVLREAASVNEANRRAGAAVAAARAGGAHGAHGHGHKHGHGSAAQQARMAQQVAATLAARNAANPAAAAAAAAAEVAAAAAAAVARAAASKAQGFANALAKSLEGGTTGTATTKRRQSGGGAGAGAAAAAGYGSSSSSSSSSAAVVPKAAAAAAAIHGPRPAFDSLWQMLAHMASRGPSIIELVAAFMAQSGLYMSRQLSYEGVRQFTLRAGAAAETVDLQDRTATAVRLFRTLLSAVRSHGLQILDEGGGEPVVDWADLYPLLHEREEVALPGGGVGRVTDTPEWAALPPMMRAALSCLPFRSVGPGATASGFRSMYLPRADEITRKSSARKIATVILAKYEGGTAQQVLKQIQLSSVVQPLTQAARYFLGQDTAVVVSVVSTGESAAAAKSSNAKGDRAGGKQKADDDDDGPAAGKDDDDDGDASAFEGDSSDGGGGFGLGGRYGGAGFGGAGAGGGGGYGLGGVVAAAPVHAAPPGGAFGSLQPARGGGAAAGAASGASSRAAPVDPVAAFLAGKQKVAAGNKKSRAAVGDDEDDEAADSEAASAPEERLRLAGKRFPVPPVPLLLLHQLGLAQHLPLASTRVFIAGHCDRLLPKDLKAALPAPRPEWLEGGAGAGALTAPIRVAADFLRPVSRAAAVAADGGSGGRFAYVSPLGDAAREQAAVDLFRLAAAAICAYDEHVRRLHLPPSPLDDFISGMGGPAHVAELSGRKSRQVFMARAPKAVLDPVSCRALSKAEQEALVARALRSGGTLPVPGEPLRLEDELLAAAAPAAAADASAASRAAKAAAAASAAQPAMQLDDGDSGEDGDAPVRAGKLLRKGGAAAAAAVPMLRATSAPLRAGGPVPLLRAASAPAAVCDLSQSDPEFPLVVVLESEDEDSDASSSLVAAATAAASAASSARKATPGGKAPSSVAAAAWSKLFGGKGAGAAAVTKKPRLMGAAAAKGDSSGDEAGAAGGSSSSEDNDDEEDVAGAAAAAGSGGVAALLAKSRRAHAAALAAGGNEAAAAAGGGEYGPMRSRPWLLPHEYVALQLQARSVIRAPPTGDLTLSFPDPTPLLPGAAAPSAASSAARSGSAAAVDRSVSGAAAAADGSGDAAAAAAADGDSAVSALVARLPLLVLDPTVPGAVATGAYGTALAPELAARKARRLAAVARVSQRLLSTPANPTALYTGRWAPVKISTAQSNEALASFQDGNKAAIVVTMKGALGRSLHAEDGGGNPARRVHFLVEQPWAADSTNQMEGRTHRVGGAPPVYVNILSAFPAQNRFIMSAQARLQQLGAYRGDRRAGAAADTTEFNYLSNQGGRALENMLRELLALQVYPAAAPPRQGEAAPVVARDHLVRLFEETLGRCCLADDLRRQVLQAVAASPFAPGQPEERAREARRRAELKQRYRALAAAKGLSVPEADAAAVAGWAAEALASALRGMLVDMGQLKFSAPPSAWVSAEAKLAREAAEAERALQGAGAAAGLAAGPAGGEEEAGAEEEEEDAAGAALRTAMAIDGADSDDDEGGGGGAGAAAAAAVASSAARAKAQAKARSRSAWYRGTCLEPLLRTLVAASASPYTAMLRGRSAVLLRAVQGAGDATGPLRLAVPNEDEGAAPNPWDRKPAKTVKVIGHRFRSGAVESTVKDATPAAVKAFFNRLLRLPLPAQNAVFAAYELYFTATGRVMRERGELETTILRERVDACAAGVLEAGARGRLLQDARALRAAAALEPARLPLHELAVVPYASGGVGGAQPPGSAALSSPRRSAASGGEAGEAGCAGAAPLSLRARDLHRLAGESECSRVLVSDNNRDLPEGLLLSVTTAPLARQLVPGLGAAHPLDTVTVTLQVDRGLPLAVAAAYYALALPTAVALPYTAVVPPATAAAREAYLRASCSYYNVSVPALLLHVYGEAMQLSRASVAWDAVKDQLDALRAAKVGEEAEAAADAAAGGGLTAALTAEAKRAQIDALKARLAGCTLAGLADDDERIDASWGCPTRPLPAGAAGGMGAVALKAARQAIKAKKAAAAKAARSAMAVDGDDETEPDEGSSDGDEEERSVDEDGGSDLGGFIVHDSEEEEVADGEYKERPAGGRARKPRGTGKGDAAAAAPAAASAVALVAAAKAPLGAAAANGSSSGRRQKRLGAAWASARQPTIAEAVSASFRAPAAAAAAGAAVVLDSREEEDGEEGAAAAAAAAARGYLRPPPLPAALLHPFHDPRPAAARRAAGDHANLTGFWAARLASGTRHPQAAGFKPETRLELGPFLCLDSGSFCVDGARRRTYRFYHPRVGAWRPRDGVLQLLRAAAGDASKFAPFRRLLSHAALEDEWGACFAAPPAECVHVGACKDGKEFCELGRRVRAMTFIGGCLLPVIHATSAALAAARAAQDEADLKDAARARSGAAAKSRDEAKAARQKAVASKMDAAVDAAIGSRAGSDAGNVPIVLLELLDGYRQVCLSLPGLFADAVVAKLRSAFAGTLQAGVGAAAAAVAAAPAARSAAAASAAAINGSVIELGDRNDGFGAAAATRSISRAMLLDAAAPASAVAAPVAANSGEAEADDAYDGDEEVEADVDEDEEASGAAMKVDPGRGAEPKRRRPRRPALAPPVPHLAASALKAPTLVRAEARITDVATRAAEAMAAADAAAAAAAEAAAAPALAAAAATVINNSAVPAAAAAVAASVADDGAAGVDNNARIVDLGEETEEEPQEDDSEGDDAQQPAAPKEDATAAVPANKPSPGAGGRRFSGRVPDSDSEPEPQLQVVAKPAATAAAAVPTVRQQIPGAAVSHRRTKGIVVESEDDEDAVVGAAPAAAAATQPSEHMAVASVPTAPASSSSRTSSVSMKASPGAAVKAASAPQPSLKLAVSSKVIGAAAGGRRADPAAAFAVVEDLDDDGINSGTAGGGGGRRMAVAVAKGSSRGLTAKGALGSSEAAVAAAAVKSTGSSEDDEPVVHGPRRALSRAASGPPAASAAPFHSAAALFAAQPRALSPSSDGSSSDGTAAASPRFVSSQEEGDDEHEAVYPASAAVAAASVAVEAPAAGSGWTADSAAPSVSAVGQKRARDDAGASASSHAGADADAAAAAAASSSSRSRSFGAAAVGKFGAAPAAAGGAVLVGRLSLSRSQGSELVRSTGGQAVARVGGGGGGGGGRALTLGVGGRLIGTLPGGTLSGGGQGLRQLSGTLGGRFSSLAPSSSSSSSAAAATAALNSAVAARKPAAAAPPARGIIDVGAGDDDEEEPPARRRRIGESHAAPHSRFAGAAAGAAAAASSCAMRAGSVAAAAAAHKLALVTAAASPARAASLTQPAAIASLAAAPVAVIELGSSDEE